MPTISSREAGQCLRNAALGVATLSVLTRLADTQVGVAIDDWLLTLAVDAEGLAHCLTVQAPDGRQASLQDWQRYGTNPVDHLSQWERQRIEHWLLPDRA